MKPSLKKAMAWVSLTHFILLTGCLIPSRAEDSALEIVAKVQKKYDEMKDATITFSQKVKFQLSKAEFSSRGVLYSKKTNCYRVETEDRIFVTDGKTVWSYSPANNQVLIDTYKEDKRTFSPEKFLVNVPKDFFAAILGREKLEGRNVVVLKLTPKEDKATMKSLKLWVDRGQWYLWKVELVDVTENTTTYTVHDIRLNTGLQDSTFAFIAPPDAEVVDLRK